MAGGAESVREPGQSLFDSAKGIRGGTQIVASGAFFQTLCRLGHLDRGQGGGRPTKQVSRPARQWGVVGGEGTSNILHPLSAVVEKDSDQFVQECGITAGSLQGGTAVEGSRTED